MSKIVFADNTEVEVNDVSSVYAITLDTVDDDEIKAFAEKLTIKNLSSVKIVNENPDMCSEGKDFKFTEISQRESFTANGEPEEPTATMFLCRPMTEVEKRIVSLGNKTIELSDGNEATAAAVEELATLIAEFL